ncbi:MAG: AEC family transporter [Peptococcaceae bacterium]|nr:AEC family transporter [Peptococcaceae bacterium]
MEWLIGKIIGIFFIIFIGYATTKIGWIQPIATKSLNKILLNIALPSLILYTITHQDMREGIWLLIYWVLGALTVVYAASTLIGRLLTKLCRVEDNDCGIYTYSLTYTNNSFLGLPVAQIIFGTASEGFFLMVIGSILSMFLMFSIGIMTLTQNHGRKRTLKETLNLMLNVPVCTALLGVVLLLLNVQLPAVVNDILSLLGSMVAPLSMLIIGVQLARSHARGVFREIRYYGVAVLRLIAIPGILYILLTLLHAPPLATAILVLTAAMPSAVAVVVFAEEYGKNAELAAGIVFITTLFSIITLPVALTLMTPLFNG